MAKLSARGATVVAKLRREFSDPEFPELGTWEQTKVLRSDGKVLLKSGTNYRIIGKLKSELTPADWIRIHCAHGWHKV